MSAPTPNTLFVTDGTLGVDLANVTSDCKYAVGESHIGSNGSEWVYCKSTGAVTSGAMCGIAADGSLVPATGGLIGTASATISNRYGFAQTAWTSSQYGFVAVRGSKILIRVLGAPAPQVPLYTSDTVGALAITTASGSQFQVYGVMVEASVSASGSTASVATANVSFPIARRPIA